MPGSAFKDRSGRVRRFVDVPPRLRFTAAYGFRNIQNVPFPRGSWEQQKGREGNELNWRLD